MVNVKSSQSLKQQLDDTPARRLMQQLVTCQVCLGLDDMENDVLFPSVLHSGEDTAKQNMKGVWEGEVWEVASTRLLCGHLPIDRWSGMVMVAYTIINGGVQTNPSHLL